MEGDSRRSIRILLVDDSSFIREGLAAVLSHHKDMEVIAEAENGCDAIEQFRHFQPTVTLMDVSMPVMDGITATRAIIREFPSARILVFSVDPDAASESLQAGATAFLLKDASCRELVQTIQTACASL